MKNLVFVIWMLGYPLVVSIGNYLSSSPEERYSQPAAALATLTVIIVIIIWGWVGWLLYEKD